MSRIGPNVQIIRQCFGCTYLDTEKEVVEDGNDIDVTYEYGCRKAAHRYIGQSATTPDWCPHPNPPEQDAGEKGGDGG